MAQYDYSCMNCDVQVTKTRSMLETDPGYLCETCGYKLIRVYSNVGVTFNGNGFYSTDNRKK